MKTLLFTAALVFCASVSAFPQNKSTYTSTRTSACRTIEYIEEGAGSYVGECKGVGGYKIRLIEGDIRQTLDVITPAKRKFELNFWKFYGAFSAIGEKIEWRTKAGVPVALIARYNVADPEGTGKGRSYLMVSKIGKAESCVTDIVEPKADQNVIARQLADTAADRPCKTID